MASLSPPSDQSLLQGKRLILLILLLLLFLHGKNEIFNNTLESRRPLYGNTERLLLKADPYKLVRASGDENSNSIAGRR